MSDVIILAIETSCDESACAIVRNGKEILSNVVSSQINVHQKFGGVIPEVASRLHVENISYVIEEAIQKANVEWRDISAIAVTFGPGLVGCLHIGLQAAKTLAFLKHKPLIGVHHLAGHIYANNFVSDLKFPVLALVVSGGHSELVYMAEEYKFEVIGCTLDDAIGESYDKVARLMGLGYPGGPIIDKLAKLGISSYPFPRVKTGGLYNFSFSGLKSATLQLRQRLEKNNEILIPEDLACSFQEAVLQQLIDKTRLALVNYQPRQLVLAGGVAANSRLRELITSDLQSEFSTIEMVVPPLWCCTDNAAMIGAAGCIVYKKGLFSDFDLSANPGVSLDNSN